MTQQVREFLEEIKAKIGKQSRVLEIGSRGSLVPREVFDDAVKYIAIDMQDDNFEEHTEIDFAANAHDIKTLWPKWEASFDTVICCETLEHDDKFWLTVENMYWALKSQGHMIITVPGANCPKHDHPSDYYRFYQTVMEDVFFKGFKNTIFRELSYSGQTNGNPDAIFGYGQKL